MRPVIWSLLVIATCCRADDDPPAPPTATASSQSGAEGGARREATHPVPFAPEPAWSPRPPRVRVAAPVPAQDAPPTRTDPQDQRQTEQPANFKSEGSWDVAGYNNDEIIYTIFITNNDSRILRCTTELQGYYFENGEKHDVRDRQSTTVFPQQRVQAGNWQGMDKSSGATYSVKCHPT